MIRNELNYDFCKDEPEITADIKDVVSDLEDILSILVYCHETTRCSGRACEVSYAIDMIKEAIAAIK